MICLYVSICPSTGNLFLKFYMEKTKINKNVGLSELKSIPETVAVSQRCDGLTWKKPGGIGPPGMPSPGGIPPITGLGAAAALWEEEAREKHDKCAAQQ